MRSTDDLVEFIRTKAKENGTSLTKIEREAGLSNGRIGKWKNQKKYPPHDSLVKIASLIGVSIEELTGEQEKPADQVADGLENETICIADKIRKATPELKKILSAALDGDGTIKPDIKKIKVTCPIDGSEQVIYQPGYRIGSIFIPECGNNGCEMCHPCNECTICRLKAVSSSLPDLDAE